MSNDLIGQIANIALALSFIVGLIFGIAQVHTAARDRKERFSLEALRDFQTREFADLMVFIIVNNMPKTRKEMRTLPHGEQVSFVHFGQKMETLGLLVAEKFISLELVDLTLGSFVTSSWEKYKPFVMNIREVPPGTDPNEYFPDPYLNEYFQWLSEQMDKRLKGKPRLPFYESGPDI